MGTLSYELGVEGLFAQHHCGVFFSRFKYLASSMMVFCTLVKTIFSGTDEMMGCLHNSLSFHALFS
jgi:hypothetical protein